jgi:polysaccharide export outer membrane protein
MLATSVSVSAQLTEGIGAPAPMTGNGSVQSQVPAPGRVEETTSAIGQAGAQPNGVPVNTGTQAAMNPAPVAASPQISVGDLLEISIFDTPELSSRLRVNNHGEVVLPLAGGVHVEGLTAPEAAQAISKKYIEAKLLVRPLVTVFIAEYAAQGVTMAGEIHSPGVYPLLGPRTLLDMVTMAGGLGESASKVISIIHRDDPSKVITIRMNVAVQTPESFAAESFPIQPGDTIFVARSGIVYVVGDLKAPGGFQVEHNERLTLLDAVALAGGPTATSKLSDARLIRRSEHGREEIQVDLKKLLYGVGPDVLLQDGDILFVPVSQRKLYTQQAIAGVIGAATGYALYAAQTH